MTFLLVGFGMIYLVAKSNSHMDMLIGNNDQRYGGNIITKRSTFASLCGVSIQGYTLT